MRIGLVQAAGLGRTALKILLIGVALVMAQTLSWAASIELDPETSVGSIRGPITPGDEKTFAELVSKLKLHPKVADIHLTLFLDSTGGDIESAMSIGRIVRDHDGWVESVGGYTSCESRPARVPACSSMQLG